MERNKPLTEVKKMINKKRIHKTVTLGDGQLQAIIGGGDSGEDHSDPKPKLVKWRGKVCSDRGYVNTPEGTLVCHDLIKSKKLDKDECTGGDRPWEFRW
jgi:hypothetical protein